MKIVCRCFLGYLAKCFIEWREEEKHEKFHHLQKEKSIDAGKIMSWLNCR